MSTGSPYNSGPSTGNVRSPSHLSVLQAVRPGWSTKQLIGWGLLAFLLGGLVSVGTIYWLSATDRMTWGATSTAEPDVSGPDEALPESLPVGLDAPVPSPPAEPVRNPLTVLATPHSSSIVHLDKSKHISPKAKDALRETVRPSERLPQGHGAAITPPALRHHLHQRAQRLPQALKVRDLATHHAPPRPKAHFPAADHFAVPRPKGAVAKAPASLRKLSLPKPTFTLAKKAPSAAKAAVKKPSTGEIKAHQKAVTEQQHRQEDKALGNLDAVLIHRLLQEPTGR